MSRKLIISCLISAGILASLAIAPVYGEGGKAPCENCMDEEGMPEPCDAEHGKYGWLDCTYFLGVCMGEERCEIPPPLPTLALQVGADGLKVGQKTYAQMESMVAVSEGWALEGFAPVSGPSAYVESGLLIKRLDCGGAIVGMLPSHEHLQEIRALTNQIIF